MTTEMRIEYARQFGASDYRHGFGMIPRHKLDKLFSAAERAAYYDGYETGLAKAPPPGREPTCWTA